jgi:hypothetical protein
MTRTKQYKEFSLQTKKPYTQCEGFPFDEPPFTLQNPTFKFDEVQEGKKLSEEDEARSLSLLTLQWNHYLHART